MNHKNFPPEHPWMRQGVMQRRTLRKCEKFGKQPRPAIFYPQSAVEQVIRRELEVLYDGYRIPMFPLTAVQPGSRGYACCHRAPTLYGMIELLPAGMVRKARGE
jgi:hypothetical protein